MNYKCSFPSEWLGLENEELQEVTGLKTAGFCHKGGFLMTTGELVDAVQACKLSMEQFHEKPVIVSFGGDTEYDELIHRYPTSSGSRNSGHLCRSKHGKTGVESQNQGTGKTDPAI